MFLKILISFIFATYFVKRYVSILFVLKSIQQYYKLINSIQLKNRDIDLIINSLNEIVENGIKLLIKLLILITPFLIIFFTNYFLKIDLIISFFISTSSYFLGIKFKNK